MQKKGSKLQVKWLPPERGTFLFEMRRKHKRRKNREELMGIKARFPWKLMLARSLFFMASRLRLLFLSFW